MTKAGLYDTYQAAVFTILAGDPSGRVIHYDPTTKKARTILSGLIYANVRRYLPPSVLVLVFSVP
jgi:hypothetical protein